MRWNASRQILAFSELLLSVFFLLFFSGCSTVPYPSSESTDRLSSHKQLVSLQVETSPYRLQLWVPVVPSQQTLRVYLEGDGFAWKKKSQPSSDPTPRNRLVHSLMLKDPASDIAYIARPCQFVMNSACDDRVWTFGRYDQAALTSMGQALDFLKVEYGYTAFELVGYSGGATLALLLAGSRDDVVFVRTVAGNLDPAFSNRFHKVSSMPTAISPQKYGERLTTIPQLHFVGGLDDVVPVDIADYYLRQFNDTRCMERIVVEGADHRQGWDSVWPSLLSLEPGCMTPSFEWSTRD